jgi:2-polyprenyl-6-methoxyphenol hydroxylase-like FAD-dependent oxidoreductase
LIERDESRIHGPFDLVLVCDGTGSRLREHTVVGAKVRPHARGVFSVVVPMPASLAADTLLQRVNAMRDGAGLLPIGRGMGNQPLASFFWNARSDELQRLKETGFTAWCDYIEGFCPEACEFLRGLGGFDALTFATTAEVSMRRWHGARTLVMGDAAHALNPQLGLGATMALLDADALTHCLRDSPDIPAALAAFQALRKPHVNRYARVSRFWSRLDSAGFLPLRRRMFLALANSPAPLRRQFLRRVCGFA